MRIFTQSFFVSQELFISEEKWLVTLPDRGIYKSIQSYEHFGEFSLIEDKKREANALAEKDSILCYLFKEDLLELFERNPKLGLKIYNNLISLLFEKLKHADEILAKQNDTKSK